jgi:ribulose 1,5-bisphosphate synthetase/thiazole synthase
MNPSKPVSGGNRFGSRAARRLSGANAGGDWMGVYSMRIVMVGAGYVGLVSGACLADFGHEIVCVEVDERKV